MTAHSARRMRASIADVLSPDPAGHRYLRGILIGALPVVILAVSPQRVALSIAVGFIYLVAALLLTRRARSDRLMLAYIALAGAFMAASLARAEYLDPLNSSQQVYAASKALYFVAAVLPMSAAVAMLVPDLRDIKPTAVVQIAVGMVVALITVGLQGERFLGVERYTWQGNLIALGVLVALQLWLIQRIWVIGLLGVLGVAGIMLAESRQSVVVLLAGGAVSAGYWWAAAAHRSGNWLRAAVTPAVLLSVSIVALQVAWLYLTLHPLFGPAIGPSGKGVANPCHCVTDRFVVLATDQGDRTTLIHRALGMFVAQPALGGGLGSYVGQVHGYQYPHSIVLEVAAELGLVGLLVFFGPLAIGWTRLGLRAVRTGDKVAATLLVLMVGYFVIANLSGDLPSARGFWILGILAMKFGSAGLGEAPTLVAHRRIEAQST